MTLLGTFIEPVKVQTHYVIFCDLHDVTWQKVDGIVWPHIWYCFGMVGLVTPDVTNIKSFLLFAMSLLTLHAMLHVWSHGVTSLIYVTWHDMCLCFNAHYHVCPNIIVIIGFYCKFYNWVSLFSGYHGNAVYQEPPVSQQLDPMLQEVSIL